MEKLKRIFAVDLGATSGRTVLGALEGDHLTMQELTRFENPIIQTGGHFYWDIYALYNQIITALKLAVEQGYEIQSIGIDTWGCDFALVGSDGALLRNPLSYRDPHTVGMMDDYFANVMERDEVYRLTGIQLMAFNSLFQLHAMRKAQNTALAVADKILFMPDALSYMLTGQAVCEYTEASTSQILDPYKHDLNERLLESVGLKRSQFGRMVIPGTIIGSVTEEIKQITGIGDIPVVAVAGHDTASAVAAVPASDANFAYLSSGTWSLMGVELSHPLISNESYSENMTNEGGVDNTTLFLKNICGMWIYERCRKEFSERKSHGELIAEAMQAEPFRSIIDPDDASFTNPRSMTEAICNYCRKTGQPVPQTAAEFCRCIFESLALRYREVLGTLKRLSPVQIDVLHIIGGGSINDCMSQFTANSCGITVLAGPQEATAIGNIMLQAKAAGMVKDVWDMRRVIGQNTSPKRFEPQDRTVWDNAFARYLQICRA
ncbi:putative rhamnulokinase [Prevotella sp. DNF00663]|uniref:rhamnulokinase n=1 Tax=Prevotella sp. DNF00663 TaxID=1384078 RepID=UPI00078245C8|nr:rhamnulokinase family protein [Prevotella sp. DNF00663]KXB81710.1 putative rhamnulokinase [Prevotella sp. DNF00663]